MLAVDNMPSSMSCLIRPADVTESTVTKRQHNPFIRQQISRRLTWGAYSYVALLQVVFVLTNSPAPDEHMALQALHGTANRHDDRVDLHSDLPCRSQDKNLQGARRKLGQLSLWRLKANSYLHLSGADEDRTASESKCDLSLIGLQRTKSQLIHLKEMMCSCFINGCPFEQVA